MFHLLNRVASMVYVRSICFLPSNVLQFKQITPRLLARNLVKNGSGLFRSRVNNE
jgi:hypothetical protein